MQNWLRITCSLAALLVLGCDEDPPATDGGMDGAVVDAGGTVCRSDRECSGSGGVCDRSTGYCVECVTIADCAAGQACLSTRCEDVTPCMSSRMCPGLVCDTDRGFCVECVTEVDCTGDEICRDGDCVPPPRACESDRQCSDIGLVCDTDLGHCVECLAEADCPSDRFCNDDRLCVPDVCSTGETRCVSVSEIETCVADGSGYGAPEACGAGRECADGACRAEPMDAGSDAGSDAGPTTDAGGTDAGPTDAGSSGDAGVDAGPVARYALSFDGVGDEVEFPVSIGDLGTTFTFETWVRPAGSASGSSEGEGGVLFIHRGGCTSDFSIEWSGFTERLPDRFRFWVYPTTGCGRQVKAEAATTSSFGAWHHVAGVFDGGAVRLYVDGSLAASVTQPDSISWAPSVGHWAGRDGMDSRPERGGFIGEIDEIRISNSARYAGASFTPPTHFASDASTVALWLFDEGTGTTTADSSSSGFAGVVRNATWVSSTR